VPTFAKTLAATSLGTFSVSGADDRQRLFHQRTSMISSSTPAAPGTPLRNSVIVLLSAKAGLRAGEIANLTWDMLVDGNGQISGLIELRDHAAKKCSGRSIPVHPDVAAALEAWRQVAPSSEYVIASERGGPMTALSIVVWFNRAFRNIGLKGCSSHSGRRTFVTRAARMVHKAGGSLRDVQLLAGHRSILTTQRYIDGDSDAQRKLVAMI
jgi:integrase